MSSPSPEAPTSALDLAPGTRLLDRYTIVERAGSGGMSSIYRATDERLDRVVCVKLLRLVLEDESASGQGVNDATYEHFLKEALALSKLQHPNTLRIYDFGYTEGGTPFQVSEFLEGGNLEAFVRARGRLSSDQTIDVLEAICGAVAEAHEHGIVHRDIKPSNILFARVAGGAEDTVIGRSFVPKLADFGIASSRVRRASLVDREEAKPVPVSSVALFSPRWAAPEQLSGAPEGPATDVYALGLLTAFMLSGRAPFAAKDAEEHYDARIQGDDFAASRLAHLALDARVREVLLRAMACSPAARIASPRDFFAEVRSALVAAASRWSQESITLVIEPAESEAPAADDLPAPAVVPPERTMTVGGRLARIVAVNEKLDLTVHLPSDAPSDENGMRIVRFRVALVPAPARGMSDGFALHLKSLSGFVVRAPSGRPTAAITATEAGAADLVSGDRALQASVAWSFGRPSDELGPAAGRVFEVGSGEMVIPYAEASQAVAIDLGPEQDLVVMCRKG